MGITGRPPWQCADGVLLFRLSRTYYLQSNAGLPPILERLPIHRFFKRDSGAYPHVSFTIYRRDGGALHKLTGWLPGGSASGQILFTDLRHHRGIADRFERGIPSIEALFGTSIFALGATSSVGGC